MSISINKIDDIQADKIRLVDESQFADIKGREISPRDLTNHISAFANADGGDLYVGITDKERLWIGFDNEEKANGHIQAFEEFFPLGSDFQYEFLKCEKYKGLVLHVQINKSQSVVKASNGIPYLRRGAQSLPMNTAEKIRRLEITKGIVSFETEVLNISKEIITESPVIEKFIIDVVPTTRPEPWLRKQNLLRGENPSRPTVAGTLLFSEEPQAVLSKHCGIKIYRYKTREIEGHRDLLAGDPLTIEGDLYSQIIKAVQITTQITESIPKFSGQDFEMVKYPPETLHEILANAVLHRDYSIKDDIHIRIFDDRVEIQSPGRLPANITPKNILDERFARNGIIVRILNKFPNPPNKDVGEGLNTAFVKMEELGLKPPVIKELDNAVLVIIKHEPLASSEEIIFHYLHVNSFIKNAKAREITHTASDFRIKGVFNRLQKAGKIEKVPGTKTSSTAWRLVCKKTNKE
jgi:ATP-dependent DNA helicase RecG